MEPQALLALGRVFAVAVAVGLDVFAISIRVGVARLAYDASLRVGLAFGTSEIAKQVIGYGLGAGASQMLGEIAAYVDFALLASIGLLRKGPCAHCARFCAQTGDHVVTLDSTAWSPSNAQ
jgi:hypothetical protein